MDATSLSTQAIPILPAVRAQGRRVTLLVAAILLMGLADLAITLTYMKSVGMLELNPIARYMLDVGSIDQLVRYKLFTMVLSCGVLFVLRKHRKAEFGAWICAAALFLLTMHWVRYNSTITDYTNDLHVLAESPIKASMWVHIPDEG